MAEDNDKRDMDRTTKAMKNLPIVIERSIKSGFSKVIDYLRYNLQTEWDKDRKQAQKQYSQDASESKRQQTMDTASDMRYKIKTAFEQNKIMDRGFMKMHKNLYNFLDTQDSRLKKFSDWLPEKVTDAFKSYGGMIKHNLGGILDQFTGPFSGLIRNTGKLLWSATSFLSPSWLSKNITSKLPKLPLPYKEEEKPGIAGGLGGGMEFMGKIYQAMMGILAAKRITTDEIKESIYEAADYVSDTVRSVMAKPIGGGGLPSLPGGAVMPPMGGLATFSRFANMIKKHHDFMHQQILYVNDYLEKIWEYFKKGGAGGGGLSSLLSGAGIMALFSKFKAFLTPFVPALKLAGKVAAVAGAGIASYRGVKEEFAGRKVEKLSDIIPKGFWNKLNPFEYAMGGGRYIGNKFNQMYNIISKKAGGAGSLGADIFDTKELIGKKIGMLVSKVSDIFSDVKKSMISKASDMRDKIVDTYGRMKDHTLTRISVMSDNITEVFYNVRQKFSDLNTSIRGIFTKIGTGFKGSIDYIKDKMDAFLPSGTDIIDALQSVLTSFMSAGKAAKQFVVDTSQRAGQAAVKTYETIKGAFNIGGSRWKAQTSGVRPEVMKPFQDMALDYKKQTGKMLTLTEGVRTREQQAMLKGGGNKYITAAPGKSMHQYGWALDVDRRNAAELKRLGLLDKYGFSQPYGEKDPVHLELARYASAKERSRLRSEAPRAAVGAMVRKSGMAEIHAAEIVSPIGKFTDMLSQTASNLAKPVVEKGAVFDASAMKHLATIAQGINKLIEVTAAGNVPDKGKSRPSTIPDMPGDPNTVFAGNYFPQKGSQWRG